MDRGHYWESFKNLWFYLYDLFWYQDMLNTWFPNIGYIYTYIYIFTSVKRDRISTFLPMQPVFWSLCPSPGSRHMIFVANSKLLKHSKIFKSAKHELEILKHANENSKCPKQCESRIPAKMPSKFWFLIMIYTYMYLIYIYINVDIYIYT